MSTTTTKNQAATAKKRQAKDAAQRTVKTVVTDAGYATVGLTDTALALARTLPTKLQNVQAEAPKLVEDAPRKVEQRLGALRSSAEKEFTVLAERGRSVVGELSKSSSAGHRAAEQARNARRQLKAATTSLRKAVFSGAEAAQDRVDAASRRAEREQYEAMTVAELQDLARRNGIHNRSEKNKQQLISALLSA